MADPATVLSYSSLKFNSGTAVETPEVGLVVFVGPNNVGKTTSVLELKNRIQGGALQHNYPNVMFESAELRQVEDDAFNEWLKRHLDDNYQTPVGQPNRRRYRNWGHVVDLEPQQMLGAYRQMSANNQAYQLLVSNGTGAPFEGQTPNLYDRQGADPTGNNRQFEELLTNEDLRTKISALSESVFGTPIGFNTAGSQAGLHFGPVPQVSFPATAGEMAELKRVPLLKAQGQGVTTFMAQAISIELGDEPLVFLDEPEAHLHPPQARKAGSFVARRAARSQVFIATHDLDYLLGLLDVNVETLIIRLDRNGDDQVINVIDQATVKQLWTDTTVRYSGVLAGLMHRGVVICESDSDCRFLEVTLDHYGDGGTPHDLRFVHAGGKGGLAKLSEAATNLAIPSVVVADFDVLRSWDDLEKLIATRRADPTAFEASWQILDNHLTQKVDQRSHQQLRGEVAEILARDADDYTTSDRRKLAEIIKLRHGWEQVKHLGTRLLSGATLTATQALLEQLDEIGIHLISSGELESMLPETTGDLHGPSWTAKVIEDGAYKTLLPAQVEFVRLIPELCSLVG